MVPLLIALLFAVPTSEFAGYSENIVAPDRVQQIFEQGLEAEERGNFEKALSIWLEAKVELNHPSLRIGRNYIRVATEQGMKEYYESASAMYRWGLSGEDITFQKQHVADELAYLEPLLNDTEREQWSERIEENDAALLQEIQRWWELRDPTPGTPYNERLIEHWERIAYARDHFTINTESVYGTDDRGFTWVKYGEPERRFEEDLFVAGGRVSNMVMEMLTTWKPGVKGTPPEWRAISKAMENAVSQMISNPRYEVWIYERDYLDTTANMVRLFGDLPGGGFSKLQSLDDLIPARAFTMTSRFDHQHLYVESMKALSGSAEDLKTRLRQGKKITQNSFPMNPSMLVQSMLYRQAASMDPIFARIYDRIERDVFTTIGPPGKYYSQNLDLENKHNALVRENQEPEEISTIGKDFPDIPLDVYRYRLLDGQNRPTFAAFVRSRPQQAFLEDLSFNQDRMITGPDSFSDSSAAYRAFGHYELIHGMELRNPQGRLAGSRIQPTLVLDGNSIETGSNSVFTVPYAAGEATQVFYAELHNRHPDTRPRVESPFPEDLRGVGKESLEQPEPLNTDPDMLEMGDLILGYGQVESRSTGGFVPFTVSNERVIPQGEALNAHIEIYHLRRNSTGLSDFTLKYEVLERNPAIIRWLDKYRSNTELTLNLQGDTSRYVENLEIKARKLESGTYLLRLVATDQISGQEITREVEFEIVE